jgi:hypothetical protein
LTTGHESDRAITYMLRGAGQPDPLNCLTLREAMARAGHPDPADWLPAGGTPDRIVTEPVPDKWVIEAAGVAHELIGLLPVVVCATRVWSEADPVVISTVMTAIPSPFLVSTTVAVRLAAHYAVAGMLPWSMIGAVVTNAFGDTPGEHAGDIDQVIVRLIAAFAAAGIPTVPAVGDRAESVLPWSLFTGRAISAVLAETGSGDDLALTGRGAGMRFFAGGISGPQDLN